MARSSWLRTFVNFVMREAAVELCLLPPPAATRGEGEPCRCAPPAVRGEAGREAAPSSLERPGCSST